MEGRPGRTRAAARSSGSPRPAWPTAPRRAGSACSPSTTPPTAIVPERDRARLPGPPSRDQCASSLLGPRRIAARCSSSAALKVGFARCPGSAAGAEAAPDARAPGSRATGSASPARAAPSARHPARRAPARSRSRRTRPRPTPAPNASSAARPIGTASGIPPSSERPRAAGSRGRRDRGAGAFSRGLRGRRRRRRLLGRERVRLPQLLRRRRGRRVLGSRGEGPAAAVPRDPRSPETSAL